MTVEPTKWAGLKKHALSAQDFRQPLLLALGEATGFRPNRPVKCRNLYGPICKIKGVTLEQFGKPDNVSTFWVERWIHEAFKSLIAAGKTHRGGRGEWGLTPDGVVEAQSLRGNLTTTPTPETDSVQDTTITVAPDDPKKLGYHLDPYIRALAIQEAPCYGLFSSVSDTCKLCPLQVHCLGAMSAELSRLRIELSEEDKVEELMKLGDRVNSPASKVDPKETTQVEVPKEPVRIPAAAGSAKKIRAQQQTFCKKCSGAIQKDEEVWWVRSDKSDHRRTPGMYHLKCYTGKE